MAERTITIYRYDSGHSGTYSTNGIGEIARVDDWTQTIEYTYNSDSSVNEIIVYRSGSVNRRFTVGYNANSDADEITIATTVEQAS